jgi:glycosyltransferase involved in cell wall biosynthesis
MVLSAVIPAPNEAGAITDTVQQVWQVLADAGIAPAEVVVVDDGSSDGTGPLAAAAGACVIRHAHNVGYGRSLKDGIVAARYETIAITDADGTYPIEDLPALFRLQQSGYDMAVGARTGPHYRESRLKFPLRTALRWMVQRTAGRRIPDVNSGFRVFSRSMTLPYFSRLCDTFSFTTSLTLAYMMNSRFVVYKDIAYHKRIGTTRVRLFRDMLKTAQFIVESAVYYNPVKIFALFSFFCLIAAASSLSVGVLTHRASFFTLGIGSILAAIIVLSLGLVCAQLKQIMDGGTAAPQPRPLPSLAYAGPTSAVPAARSSAIFGWNDRERADLRRHHADAAE